MDARIGKTRQKLHESLIHLLKTNELQDISVSALCREANINRNTFYSHYDNVAELLQEIIKINTDRQIKTILETAPYSDFDRMMTDVCRSIYADVSLQELMRSTKFSTEYIMEVARRCNEVVVGSFRLKDGVDPKELETVNRYATGGTMLLIRDWCAGGMQESPESVAKKTAELSRRLLLPLVR